MLGLGAGAAAAAACNHLNCTVSFSAAAGTVAAKLGLTAGIAYVILLVVPLRLQVLLARLYLASCALFVGVLVLPSVWRLPHLMAWPVSLAALFAISAFSSSIVGRLVSLSIGGFAAFELLSRWTTHLFRAYRELSVSCEPNRLEQIVLLGVVLACVEVNRRLVGRTEGAG